MRPVAVLAAAAALAVVLVLARPGVAVAEEGLFIARAGGGVASPRSEMPAVDQLWTMSMDLTIGERAGMIGTTQLLPADESFTWALGLGFKYLLVERMWQRFFVHLGPQLLIVWPDGQDARWDIALEAGLGYEHLLTWGFGLVFEIHGTAPAGRGPAEPLDAATAGATAGLFMEF